MANPPIPDHPRNHALTIAAANQLHRGGHISAAKRAQIAAKARAQINAMKVQPKQPTPMPFGSLAPELGGEQQ